MICYHWSDVVVEVPKILKSKRPLDFGVGFYVTSNKEQATKWSTIVALRNNNKKKYVNKYEFNIDEAINKLRILYFSSPNEEWLKFVCDNRKGKSTSDYDIVIGPVADDKVYRVVLLYEHGDIDKDLALKKLKTEKLCDQILFHTEKSLEYLKFIEVEELNNG